MLEHFLELWKPVSPREKIPSPPARGLPNGLSLAILQGVLPYISA